MVTLTKSSVVEKKAIDLSMSAGEEYLIGNLENEKGMFFAFTFRVVERWQVLCANH
jgi:hypothetical protein